MRSTEPIPDWTVDPNTRAERVAARFRERFAGEPELWARAPGRVDLMGSHTVIHSTVPLESGLSSSAALESAVATVFAGLGGWDLTNERKALLCQKGENEFVGVKCGILDQYSSCLGRQWCALLLDCRDLSTRAVWIAGGIRIVICNTMSRRRLSGGEYAQRRAECEQAAAVLGVSSLRDATPEMLAARLCSESFAGARDLYEICSPAMVAMMDAMLAAPGVIGARQAGAGFGGCMVALVDAARTDDFRTAVLGAYYRATQVRAEVYPVEAAQGVEVFDKAAIVR